MSDEEGDDNPLKECRGTEPRLALLQLFSIGIRTSLSDDGSMNDETMDRPLSAPASLGNRQDWSYHDYVCSSGGIKGDIPVDRLGGYLAMTELSSSLASVDTQQHSNKGGQDRNEITVDPDVYTMSSINAKNIAQREFVLSHRDLRDLDASSTRFLSNNCTEVVDAVTSTTAGNSNHHINTTGTALAVPPLYNNIADIVHYPVNTTTSGKSFWYAQQRQEQTKGIGISLYDTRATDVVRAPDIDTTINTNRLINIAVNASSTSSSNCIKSPLVPTNIESVACRTESDSAKFIPLEVFSSSSGIVHSKIELEAIAKHLNSDDLKLVYTSSAPILAGISNLRLSTMPATNTRSAAPVENGGVIQHDTAYNRSNGRVPVARPQNNNNNNNNEVQRNPPSSGNVMNGVAQTDQNSTTNFDTAVQQPTPLFERLVTEEVQELRAYVRIVENQNRRLVELERVHGDLEVRLEIESKNRQQLEATLESREREWAELLEHIERDRDNWKAMVEAENIKNSKLLDQLYRKDQDIHRMLQRKYDTEITRSTRSARTATAITTTGGPANEERDKFRNPSQPGITSKASSSALDQRHYEMAHKGPHEILEAVGSAEKVRNRNVKSLLMDMFGI